MLEEKKQLHHKFISRLYIIEYFFLDFKKTHLTKRTWMDASNDTSAIEPLVTRKTKLNRNLVSVLF